MNRPSTSRLTVREALDRLEELGLLAGDVVHRVDADFLQAPLDPREVLQRMPGLHENVAVALRVLAEGIPVFPLADRAVDLKLAGIVPPEFVHRYLVVPVAEEDGCVTLAMTDPFDLKASDDFTFLTGKTVRRTYAPPGAIEEAIRVYYGSTVETMIRHLDEPPVTAGLEGDDAETAGHLHEIARDPSIVNLVNLILLEAIQKKASDVHVEPFEKLLKLRYRIDGFLHEMPLLPKHLQAGILSRIKIMAKMDIAERVKPQDGHIEFLTPDQRRVDLRVATVPTLYGESLVLRILDKSVGLLDLDNLGVPPDTLVEIRRIVRQVHGIILVTGPTGSGKTTTLYAALREIYDASKKIITIEDPVEYELEGVNQIPVLPKRGITFAGGLRAILRQDPDIVMVGEIRDRETADIAIRSALTGHLVLSTLHTNNAVGAITRLLDMGVEPYLAASSLEAALAQRLVRCVCPYCVEEVALDEAQYRHFTVEMGVEVPPRVRRGRGCANCMNTGYLGRTGVFELFRVTPPARELITARASADRIAAVCMPPERTMRFDGFRKVSAGRTTLEEVLRVTQAQNNHASETPS